MREIYIILHDIRSTHNVGSLFRTADCFGTARIFITGYTPYPEHPHDSRLPHIKRKLSNQIHKTALGAELSVPWSYHGDIASLIRELQNDNFQVVALEQASNSIPMPAFKPPDKCALLVGREVEGIEARLLKLCDAVTEIPMYGQKESLNVAQAAAVALYQLREA